jgi:hypothetical protein
LEKDKARLALAQLAVVLIYERKRLPSHEKGNETRLFCHFQQTHA